MKTEIVGRQCKTEAELVELCREADAVLTQFARVSATVIAALTRARVIVRCGIGLDNVDLSPHIARGSPGAEFTVRLSTAQGSTISRSAAQPRPKLRIPRERLAPTNPPLAASSATWAGRWTLRRAPLPGVLAGRSGRSPRRASSAASSGSTRCFGRRSPHGPRIK
jgi:hypothetical protein